MHHRHARCEVKRAGRIAVEASTGSIRPLGDCSARWRRLPGAESVLVAVRKYLDLFAVALGTDTAREWRRRLHGK